MPPVSEGRGVTVRMRGRDRLFLIFLLEATSGNYCFASEELDFRRASSCTCVSEVNALHFDLSILA